MIDAGLISVVFAVAIARAEQTPLPRSNPLRMVAENTDSDAAGKQAEDELRDRVHRNGLKIDTIIPSSRPLPPRVPPVRL